MALIDDEDAALTHLTWSLWKGRGGHEYVVRHNSTRGGMARSQVALHRVVMGVTNPKIRVDHRDGNGLNCQKSNLRIATAQINGRNRAGPNSNTTTGHLGVSRCGDRFRATIRVDGRVKNLGRTDTVEAAIAARLAAEKTYWGIEPRREEAHRT